MTTQTTETEKRFFEIIENRLAVLNNAADDATDRLIALEKRLIDMGVGIYSYSQHFSNGDDGVDDEGAEDYGHELCLCFDKTDGKWGISIVELNRLGNGREWKPMDRYRILNAPISYRIQAAEHIQSLLRDIAERLEERIGLLAPMQGAA